MIPMMRLPRAMAQMSYDVPFTEISPALLRPSQAAAYLGISPSTLAKFRLTGDGPPFIKLGSKCVAYRREDIETWLDTRLRRSTSMSTPLKTA